MVKEALRQRSPVDHKSAGLLEIADDPYSHHGHFERRLHMTAASKTSWSVANAKAHFSELIDKAKSEGPQTVTRNGKPAAVLVSVEEWEKKTARKGTLVEFFQNSPLYDSGIEIERFKGGFRKVDL
jgi:prevent-host-death family protein